MHIGAGEGTSSPSSPLFCQTTQYLNWEGILVEPVPILFEALVKSYSHYPTTGRISFERRAVCPSPLHGTTVRFYHINTALEAAIRASLEISTNVFAWDELSMTGTLSRETMEAKLKKLFAIAYLENHRYLTDDEYFLIEKYVNRSEISVTCTSYEKLIDDELNHSPKEIDFIHISAADATGIIVHSVLDFYIDHLSSELNPPEIFCFDTSFTPFNDARERKRFTKLGYACNSDEHGFSGNNACCFRGWAKKLARKMGKNEEYGIPLNLEACTRKSGFLFKPHTPFEPAGYDYNLLSTIQSTRQDGPSGLPIRCDWVIGTRVAHWRYQDIRSAYGSVREHPETIFVMAEHLQNFNDFLLPCLHEKFVLILGDHDLTIPLQTDKRYTYSPSPPKQFFSGKLSYNFMYETWLSWLDDNRIKRIYVNHLDEEQDSKKVIPFPIGINPDELPQYILQSNMDNLLTYGLRSKFATDEPPRIVFVNRIRNDTQFSRRKYVKQRCDTDWKKFCISKRLLGGEDFLSEVGKFHFVLCVHGGGIEPNPLVWTTLLAGSVPIVEWHPGVSIYENLPVIIVPSWDTLTVDTDSLKSWVKMTGPFFTEKKFPGVIERLMVDYWWDKIVDDVGRTTSKLPVPYFSFTADVQIDYDRQTVTKTGTRFKPFDPIKREACILKLLQKFDWCPRIISVGENVLVSSWAGEAPSGHNLPPDYREQMENILRDLNSVGIKHNDIVKRNDDVDVLIHGGKIRLIDFSWATVNGSWACEKGISRYAPAPLRVRKDTDVLLALGKLNNSRYKPYRDKRRTSGSQSEMPSLSMDGDDLIVQGYQAFSVSSNQLILSSDPTKYTLFYRKLKYLHDVYGVNTLLDIGSNAGLILLMAHFCGYSGQIYGLDHDIEYINVSRSIFYQRKIANISVELFSFGDELPLRYRSEVVVMGAVLHWIFSCTAMFPDFAAIFKYLYPVVGRFLLVEWIDRFDPAVKSFNHLTCSGSDHREMYTLSKFEQEVQKFANILGKDPTRGPSRILYVLELRKVSYKTNTLKGILLAQSIPFGENHQYLKRCANPNNTSCHAKSYLDIVHSGSSHDSIRLRRTVEATCRVPGVDVNIIGAFRKNKENTRITVYSTIRYYNEQLHEMILSSNCWENENYSHYFKKIKKTFHGDVNGGHSEPYPFELRTYWQWRSPESQKLMRDQPCFVDVGIRGKDLGALVASSRLFVNFQCSSSIELSADFLIFTKDRPYEVANLLASIYRHVSGFSEIHVIYKYTFGCARDGYNLVKRHFPHVQFWDESIVKSGSENSSMFEYYVHNILKNATASHVIPLVAETFFIRHVDLRSIAKSLVCFDHMSTVQLRLGTNLAIYGQLLRDGRERFASISNVDTKLLKFNMNLFPRQFRKKGNENRIYENDFWYVTNMVGALVSTSSLREQWRLLSPFKHPGDLERRWYSLKDRLPTHHLMPMTSYIVGNIAYPDTRPDHLRGRLSAPHESTLKYCSKFVGNYSSAIMTELDGTKQEDVNVNLPFVNLGSNWHSV